MNLAKILCGCFFKSRGRNFVLSVLAFLAVFFSLRSVHRYLYKGSSIHRTVASSFYVRLADVLYHILTFVGATGALLIVLYVCGDWVLLGLAFIFIFGLIWTAKQTIPRFYEHGKILLNLGTVKENDWVVLADETFGRVAMQTPEMVQLFLAGGSYKTYPTAEFLRQNPINISKNFRINVTFGVDYQYQPICTTEIPDKLKGMIKAGLENEGYGDDLLSLSVEFKEVGDSSLDYAILADFSGQYFRMELLFEFAVMKISI